MTMDCLGKYICFHNYRGSVNAAFEGPLDKYYFGRRPTQPMMPNFRNVHKQEMDFLEDIWYFLAQAGAAEIFRAEEEMGAG